MATTVAMEGVDLSVKLIAGKLMNMLYEEASLPAGVKDDVRRIVHELGSISHYLTDMPTRWNLDAQLQNWVREVMEVAYDAEDSMDELVCLLKWIAYDGRGVKGFLMRFYRRIKSVKARHGIASELKKLKVEEIRKRHDSHPTEAPSSCTAISLDMADRYSDLRIITPFVDEQSRDTLIKWVMDETYPDLTTISLVGYGGLGKTTWAQVVYNDSIVVEGRFQYRAWISVSQNYNIGELLKQIILKICVEEQQIQNVYGCHDRSLNTEQLLNMMDDQQLVETIRAHLQGKRYLLVLDNVWTTEAWRSLSIALPSGKEGSRVIVTTRYEEVANSSCARHRQFIFKVSPLSAEISWKLFCRKVFDAPDYNCPPELENVGREILQKCHGLPLAIVTIGGLLASKHVKRLQEWIDLRDHLHLEIETNDMLSALKDIKVEEEEIRKRHDRYSRPNEATGSGTAISLDMADRYFDPRIIGHFVEEAQLVGINQSRDMLMKWVMDKNCLELTVISLVGMGGVGKTILAKTVYDDSIIVGGYFQYRAWIAVSQNYNIKELLKKIIRQISVKEQQIRDVLGCQDANLNTEELLNRMPESGLMQIVRGHLHGKRYLLVFDDVWATEAWEYLSISLPQGKEGSRVIVTTRSEDVANISCSDNRQFIFKVSPLSPESSLELFRRKVFEAPDYGCPPELQNISREIVEKCKGLPLAIVAIGGLLDSKPDKKLEAWKDLRDHLHSEIQTNHMLSDIHQILGLSYNDLPYELKLCFLFLGIFPENYEIRRKHLMRRWIAEGFVIARGRYSAEKMAERFFNELVSLNLVQPSEFDEIGMVKSCRVHAMMLEVIISISRKQNFLVLLNEQLIIPPHQKIKRLSCHGESSGQVPPDTDLSHLRSFTAFDNDAPLKYYGKQRRWRIIDLKGCRTLFHLHPKSFSKLFLLKYLSLRDTGLSELPDSIGYLQNLQFLDIRDSSSISALPDSIGDLQNLEFLDIRGTDIQELPSTIAKLQKLIYLLAGCYFILPFMKVYSPLNKRLKVPKGIRNLQKLRVFGMACADDVELLQEIGELVELEKLAICFGDNDLSHRMLKEISNLLSKLHGRLQSLTILHFASGDLKEALDEVVWPPLQLRKLKIHANLGGLPAWFASLDHVVKITLYETRLPVQDLRVLRNLQNLVKLFLGFKAFNNAAEHLVFDHGGFPYLKFLEIESQSVSFEEGALQRLQILKMFGYFLGDGIRGTEHLDGIKEFHIYTGFRRVKERVENIAANHSKRPECFARLLPEPAKSK